MKHWRGAAFAVYLVLVLSAVFPPEALGKCDPGRPWASAWRRWGSDMGAQAGVIFYELASNVENRIPFVEPTGISWAHVELVDKTRTLTADRARAFVALGWGWDQGRLDSSYLRMRIENENGDGQVYNYIHHGIPSGVSLTNPRLLLAWQDVPGTFDRVEEFVGAADSFQIGRHQGWWDNAENFNSAQVFSATNNNSSQVPGGLGDPQEYRTVVYRSQYGYGDHTTQGRIRDEHWGDSNFGSGWTNTWDWACAQP